MADPIRIWWYDHDCEWISKYCDEHHRKSALVPAEMLGESRLQRVFTGEGASDA